MNSFAAKVRKNFKSLSGRALLLVASLMSVACAYAVSDAEMEQAKAIAAKYYIRFMNNGSGYLDDWTPSNMTELENKLANDKDRESLNQFRKASVARDYSSWDKDKLTSYWSATFFSENSSALDNRAAGNELCKVQIKKAIGSMKVSAPSAAPENQEGVSAADLAADSAQLAQEAAIEQNLENVEGEIAEAQDLVAQEGAQEGGEKKSSGTWVYIMVLAILVAVVIFLVVYASRTMKGETKIVKKEEKNKKEDEDEDDGIEEYDDYEDYKPKAVEKPREAATVREEPSRVIEPVVIAKAEPTIADETRMREKYAESLASKTEEIRALKRQLQETEDLAGRLKEENRLLKAEIDHLRSRRQVETQPERHHHPEHHDRSHKPQHETSSAPAKESREVYLGRVNSRGIFVRADKHAVDGQSVYKLTTTNGTVGTYTIINNPLIAEQMLDDPGKWLVGGCFAKDIFDTEGRVGILTETPGTAVFKDGAWRVERKARIRYE